MEDLGLTPLFARVLIEREEVKLSTTIIIPENSIGKFQPAKGILIAAGETCEQNIKDLVGEMVIYGRYAGDKIEAHGKEYWICNEEDLLGVENGRTVN